MLLLIIITIRLFIYIFIKLYIVKFYDFNKLIII